MAFILSWLSSESRPFPQSHFQTCITLADFGCSLRVRNLDGYTGLELLEKFKKSNNELWQVCFANILYIIITIFVFCSGHLCRTVPNKEVPHMSGSRCKLCFSRE